jgi:hypothetical protein
VVQFRSAVVNIPAVRQHTSTKFDARGTSAISKSVKPFLASIGALAAKIELLWRKSPFVRSANPRSSRFSFET